MFRPKKTRIKLYDTLALPTLLYSSANWTIKAEMQNNNSSRDEIYEKNSRIHLDRSQNKYRDCKGIKYNQILDKIQDYKRNWIKHVNQMPRNRLRRLIKNHTPKGRGTKEDH
jgi:DNA modification methylase